MAQSVRCLLHKLKDVSSDPQPTHTGQAYLCTGARWGKSGWISSSLASSLVCKNMHVNKHTCTRIYRGREGGRDGGGERGAYITQKIVKVRYM